MSQSSAKQLVIVTGLSGSGKSIVLKALEDNDIYCVDNLPASLLTQVWEHLADIRQQRIAISIDTRSASLEVLPEHIQNLQTSGIDVQVIFLESDVETLVKRFSETRRRHPLSSANRTLAESIRLEREMLSPLAQLGHRIDTSQLSANTLKNWVREFLSSEHQGMMLLFSSFGFKHGLPLDADYVFDVRCLPNPFYDPALRPLTGKDQPVKDFLLQHPSVEAMQHDITALIEKWLPYFISDNRSYLTVALGCTGGQHRSVYLAENLTRHFIQKGHRVMVRHRELEAGISTYSSVENPQEKTS